MHDSLKINAAVKGLESNSERQKSEAIEILGSIGKIGKLLLDIFQEKNNPNLKKEKLEKTQLLTELTQVSDFSWLQMCAIYSIGFFKLKSLTKTVESFYHHQNPLLHKSAGIALNFLDSKKITKISIKQRRKNNMELEKLIFLRTISIFDKVSINDLQWISKIMQEKNIKSK